MSFCAAAFMRPPSGDGVVSLGEFLEWYFGGDHADDGPDHGEDVGAQLNESLV